jgi:signal transduction histidine kinase
MLRLYLRFYLALLASLVLFVGAAAVLWHVTGRPMEQAGVRLGRLVQNILPDVQAPPADQQDALRRLATGLSGDVTLFGPDGAVIAAVGRPLPPPAADGRRVVALSRWDNGAVSTIRLADGRTLVASVPLGFRPRPFVFHLMLVLLAAAIGLAALPIVRQLSRRLERLQRGVESLGEGDLGARVAVEGRDEVARLAGSFNRAAGQIEHLVGAHRSLLANASHELRTPLARIRLAVEMLKGGVDLRIKAGLEQDIAELDQLIDEILMASRLETVRQPEAGEEVDLLALAAEECSRYDEVVLDGVPVQIHGDPRLLRRLLRNLLENARRHGAPPTQVRVAREGAVGVLTVWDSGLGPQPEEYERIFTPFYRRSDGRSGNRDSIGTGLGLALVRQIARRHGGDARCAPMADGRASFVVTLAAQ